MFSSIFVSDYSDITGKAVLVFFTTLVVILVLTQNNGSEDDMTTISISLSRLSGIHIQD